MINIFPLSKFEINDRFFAVVALKSYIWAVESRTDIAFFYVFFYPLNQAIAEQQYTVVKQ